MTASRLSLAEFIRRTVSEGDAAMAGQVCDELRFRHGLNYDQIQRMVEELTGLDAHGWEALMYEADTLEAKPTKS